MSEFENRERRESYYLQESDKLVVIDNPSSELKDDVRLGEIGTTPKECEARKECRQRNRTVKGLQMDFEIAKKKQNKAINALKIRIKDTYESLRLPQDITKLLMLQDGLELDLARVNNLQDELVDLSIKLENESDIEDEAKFKTLVDAALECIAEVKVKLKDLEIERFELLSKSSARSNRSTKYLASNATNSHGTLSSLTIRDKMKDLKKRQELERQREDLERRQRELQREFERERIRSELTSAEIIEKILQEPAPPETDDRQLITTDNIQDPWDITALRQLTPVRTIKDATHTPLTGTVTPSTGSHGLKYQLYTGSSTDERDLQLFKCRDRLERETLKEEDTRNPAKVSFSDLGSKQTVKVKREELSTAWPVRDRNSNELHPEVKPPFTQERHSTPYSPQLDFSLQFSSIQRENAQIQRQQVELLRRLTLPPPKPPVFEGDILDYPKWESAFEALVEEEGTAAHKLYYLGQYTGGVAQKSINGLLGLKTNDAYLRARKVLKDRYGNPYKIYEAYRRKLFDWPACTSGETIQELSDFLIMTQETMKTVGYLKELNSLTFLRQLATKLPSYYCNRWRESARTIEEKEGDYTFDNMVEFVLKVASDATHPVFSLESLAATKREMERDKVHGNYNKPRSAPRFQEVRHARGTAFSTAATSISIYNEKSSSSNQSCPLCNGSHTLEKCEEFIEKDPERRVEVCKSNGICFMCLMKGHIARECKAKDRCSECSKRHATLLHFSTPSEEKPHQETAKATNNCVSVCQLNDCSNTTSAMIVPVTLHHQDKPECEVEVYAVLDDQSDSSFVTSDVCKRLGVTGSDITLELATMHSVQNIATQKIEGLVVSRPDKGAIIPLPKVYSRDVIPARREQIPRPDSAWKWKHLQPIAQKIPPYEEDRQIGILIGTNCVRAIKPREVIPGRANDPYAIRTVLGWSIVGAVMHDRSNSITKSNCHKIAIRGIEPEREGHVMLLTQPDTYKEVISPSAVKQMFERDFSEYQGSDTQAPRSQEDLNFLKVCSEGIHQTNDGHYEMPLPLKDPNIQLPHNRKLAEVRLKQLKVRFSKEEQYRKDYINFVEGMLEKGYAEEAPGDSKNAWYLPHHGVYHPKKRDKIRVVFDCSAKYEGHSLNNHLMQGPDLTNSLLGVLCRFRQEPVALTCDIEGMFQQVRVNPEHRDYLRFLWWEKGDTSKEPKEYRMRVHLFGATSSPACANLALKATADDNEADLGSEPAQFLRKNFYVDDGLKSVKKPEEAVALIKKGQEMCRRGGFRLHKLTSNLKSVIESVPEEDRATGLKNIDLDKEPLPLERVLGVEWCIESDALKFRITLKNKPLTRRGVLATVSSIYDPLGLAAPFLLRGKRILQLLCKDNVGWDDPLPSLLRVQWERWRAQIPVLENLTAPRCFKPKDFGEVQLAELHHFSDASNEGYGECSYLRLTDDKGKIHCSLVMGKARVAPLKPITIPRLELTAAVVSVKASAVLRRELEYDSLEETFWTDSMVVKAYIKNDTKRFHTFVANRVQQVREHSNPEQWMYVASENNPADDASRGLSAHDLVESSRWLRGPQFLWEPKENWEVLPENEDQTPVLPSDDKEVKKVSTFTTTTSPLIQWPSLIARLSYFSDWFRAAKAVTLCLRYIKILRLKVNSKRSGTHDEEKPSNIAKQPIKVQELKLAETKIIKDVQQEAFLEEVKTLNQAQPCRTKERNSSIKRSSQIYRLDPYVDQDGVLRVGGRLQRSNLSEEVKHPAIMPRRGHLTQLLIRHFHNRTNHQGRGVTTNEIRSSGYWIVGCTAAVSEVLHNCTMCRKLRADVQNQKMADLPSDRLQEAPPFTYAGVDYFGPWHVKEGRKVMKRYGVMFTCLASRAIHLEVAHSLETDSFLNALRRFVCRRGPVRVLRSDNGTNFIGASRELKECLKEMDQRKIAAELLKTNCDWIEVKFNPPAASHMGGVWERQIRSVRGVLSALLQKNGEQLNDEALLTFMCEAESIVNSRPLTTDNLASGDLPEPLTPNHLLTMKSKVVLPPPGNFQVRDMYARKWWRRVQHLSNEFWCRWKKEYLQSLQQRPKWTHTRRNMQVGDIVILKNDNAPRSNWQLARVTEVFPSDDGLVRRVKIDVGRKSGTGPLSSLERPIHKLVLLCKAQV